MRRFYSYLLLAFFPFCLKGQGNFDNYSSDLITRNRIKSITEWSHSYHEGKPARNGKKTTMASFDRNGNMLQEITYNAREEESRKVTNRYDRQGKQIEYSLFEARFSRITYSQFSQYDAAGNKTTEWGFDGLGNYRNNYSYDRNGNLLEISFLTQNSLNEKRVYKISGRETEITLLSKGITPSYTIILRYNDWGKLLEEKTIDLSGKQLKRVLYDFNPDGQMRSETRYHGENLSYINRYRYDSRARLVEIEKEEKGSKPVVTHIYSYDSGGNLSEEHWYSESARDYSVKKYRYDQKGILTEVDAYFVSYNYRVLYKYSFTYH